MEVSFAKAVSFFNAKFQLNRVASLHPEYIEIDAKRDISLIPVYFIYETEQGFLYHAFHKTKITGSNFYDAQSTYGYGGPVIDTSNKEFIDQAWQIYQAFCQREKILVEFIRFHPILNNEKYYHGEVFFNRNTVIVDLTADDLLSSYQVRSRTAIRKAAKENVEISLVTHMEFPAVFKDIYYDSMRKLKASNFYFFNDNYIQGLSGWDSACLFVAKRDNEIISVAMFLLGTEVLEYHLSASTDEGRKLSAIQLLLHKAFLMAKEKGCRYAHLGGGVTINEDDPLFFFKRGFSNKRVPYSIGKYIYDKDAYQQLKSSWEEKNARKSTRVLFYKNS